MVKKTDNEVTEHETGGEIDPYAEVAGENTRGDIYGDLLKYTKHGQWKYGINQQLMAEGTKLVFFMPGMKKGYVKWEEGMPVERRMGLVVEGFKMPHRDELGDLDEKDWPLLDGRPIDPWQKTYNIPCCNGNGDIFTFITSSKGGISAVSEVSGKYSQRKRMKPDEIPVIEIGGRSYDHKLYGETFAPVLTVIGWAKIPETFHDLKAAIGGDIEGADETLFELEDLKDDEPAPRQSAGRQAPPRQTTVRVLPAPSKPDMAAGKKAAGPTAKAAAAKAAAPAKKGGARSVKF